MRAEIIIECDFGIDPSVTPDAVQHLADDLAGQAWEWNEHNGSFVGKVKVVG